eukprot:TRINITY_DN1434_c0_g1_i3.p1 TRINITY_DN1434_c0_g1~~TRINITY_DN1434_c0_g1_i3.p1  ORF type:complete len:381 (+),score=24.20 TRINITY_DN1434_c0_g1_i3:41-1144(+)
MIREITQHQTENILPKQVADVLWSCGNLNFKDEDIIQFFCDKYLTIIDKSKLTDSSNILWACDVLHFFHESLFENAGYQLSNQIENATSWNISTAIRCFGNHGYVHDILMKKVEKLILEKKTLDEFKFDDIWRMISGYAKLGCTQEQEQLYLKLANEIVKSQDMITGKMWILCGWGLCVAGMINPNFKSFWQGYQNGFNDKNSWRLKDERYLKQFCQIYETLNLCQGDEIYVDLQKLPQELIERSKKHWQLQQQQGGHVSDIQFEIYSISRSLGYEVELEHLLQPGFNVDMYCSKEGEEQFVVEVDGPSHYSCNQSERLLGSTQWRNRLIEAIGAKYVTVPIFEWQKLGERVDKNNYLSNKIAAIQG